MLLLSWVDFIITSSAGVIIIILLIITITTTTTTTTITTTNYCLQEYYDQAAIRQMVPSVPKGNRSKERPKEDGTWSTTHEEEWKFDCHCGVVSVDDDDDDDGGGGGGGGSLEE